MVWLFKSVMVISLEWPHVRVVTVMILSSVCMVLRISRVGDPFASVVSISVISSQLNVDKRSFVVCGSPVFCVMRGFLMRPSPVGVVQTNFMGWFETWVDIASSGFVCLAHSMGFSGSVPERFFMELNILSVLSNCFMIGRVWKLMWMNNEWSLVWFNYSGVWVKSTMV